jgi:hypothetical protein
MPVIPPSVYAFLGGAVLGLTAVASLLFARFYRRTRDRLFLHFSVAFAVLSLNNLLFITVMDRFTEAPEDARHPLLYGPRLIAFGLILYAIIDKNRARGKM